MKSTQRLRDLLARPGAVMAPGVADALNARLVKRHGFEAVYMTGAGTTAVRLGMPDVGLLTATEMIDNAGRIAEASGLPLIADADNGYGGVLNVRRTIQGYERAGVAGVHLEDQVIPKRCGHLAGKQVVPVEEARPPPFLFGLRERDGFGDCKRHESISHNGCVGGRLLHSGRGGIRHSRRGGIRESRGGGRKS